MYRNPILPELINSTAVFAVDGDLAGPETAALAGKLWLHLLEAPEATTIDLGAAGTLDEAAVDLLAAAHTYAQHRGSGLHIINAAPDARRELRAAGVPSTAPALTATA